MQPTSKAYKSEQKQHLREKSYVWVYLGVVSREAQRSAQITSPVTEWSMLPTDNDALEGVYATYEQNFFRADGSQMFPPETWAMYQGAASAAIGGSITFTFDRKCDIRGITLKFFDDAVPTRFTISNGKPNQTYTYTYDPLDLDENHKWSCESLFTGSTYITITPITLKGGNQRMRIQQILFGKGFYFSDKDLLSTSRKNTIAHLSDKLPSKSFSFTIDNSNKKFAADDPHSFVHFLQEQQEVEFDYGRDLPDGSIYTIKGGRTYLKTWSNDDQKATFNTVGYLDFMDTTYVKGVYSAAGRSLYDLAVDVFTDAGITEYHIDSYLKQVTTHNPLPIEKHKNLLQLIANAGMCIFYEDRDGIQTIGGSFESEMSDIYANSKTAYTNLDNILDQENAVVSYASYEKDFWRADGLMRFLPSGNNYVNCGYISEVESGSNGLFGTNPKLTMEWEATWTWYNMVLRFATAPLAITVNLYKDGTLTDTFDIEADEIDTTTIIDHIFYDVNKMEIMFTKTSPYQRLHLDKLMFGKITDYKLEYKDLLTTPSAGTTEFVKNVVCHFYEFGYGTEVKQLGTIDAVAGENIITFANPAHDVTAAYESAAGTITITGRYASCIIFTASVAGKVVVSGKEYTVLDSEVQENIRNVGVDKTSKNILLDNKAYAERNLGWLSDYYKNDVEYSLDYRGEPAIDCDDQIYLENKYVAKNLIRVIEESIETSQGMNKCTLKARRVSYKEPAKVDYAIVDISEVE